MFPRSWSLHAPKHWSRAPNSQSRYTSWYEPTCQSTKSILEIDQTSGISLLRMVRTTPTLQDLGNVSSWWILSNANRFPRFSGCFPFFFSSSAIYSSLETAVSSSSFPVSFQHFQICTGVSVIDTGSIEISKELNFKL